jgi:hydrogenase maturation protease
MTTRPDIAVIGVGNDFRRDDASPAAVHRLLDRTTVRALLQGPSPGLDHAVVAMDAAPARPAHPGRVHRLELAAARPGTAHEGHLGVHALHGTRPLSAPAPLSRVHCLREGSAP